MPRKGGRTRKAGERAMKGNGGWRRGGGTRGPSPWLSDEVAN